MCCFSVREVQATHMPSTERKNGVVGLEKALSSPVPHLCSIGRKKVKAGPCSPTGKGPVLHAFSEIWLILPAVICFAQGFKPCTCQNTSLCASALSPWLVCEWLLTTAVADPSALKRAAVFGPSLFRRVDTPPNWMANTCKTIPLTPLLPRGGVRLMRGSGGPKQRLTPRRQCALRSQAHCALLLCIFGFAPWIHGSRFAFLR